MVKDGQVQPKKDRFTGVAENRVTPIIAYLLIGLPILIPALLNYIPTAVMNGTAEAPASKEKENATKNDKQQHVGAHLHNTGGEARWAHALRLVES